MKRGRPDTADTPTPSLPLTAASEEGHGRQAERQQHLRQASRTSGQGASQRSVGTASQLNDRDSQRGKDDDTAAPSGSDLRGYLQVAARHARASYEPARKQGKAYTFSWLEEGVCCFAFPGSWSVADWEVNASFKSIPWVTVSPNSCCSFSALQVVNFVALASSCFMHLHFQSMGAA